MLKNQTTPDIVVLTSGIEVKPWLQNRLKAIGLT
jgi:hypothetical protein